jgi:hypothetical protein
MTVVTLTSGGGGAPAAWVRAHPTIVKLKTARTKSKTLIEINLLN